MLKRKITEYLLSWKQKTDKKPLVIRGARQVGKTYIVEKFGKDNYKHYIYINFEKDIDMKSIFDGNLDVDEIIQKMKLKNPSFTFEPKETLIFFDEIQKGGNCRTALKFFAIDGRYDIISSGSLLGLYHEDVNSFPVGYVENIEMQSLDFEEFCAAIGISNEIFDLLKKSFIEKNKIDEFIHQEMLKHLIEYIVVGGMPEAVNKYIETKDYREVDKVKKDIIILYRDDVAKYAKESEKEKILACFDSIPRHLAKTYKKFKYSEISEGASSRKYGGALEFLYDAGIINYCYNLSKIEFPFEGYVIDKEFKVYMKDTGLLVTMLGFDMTQEILNGNLKIYKGAIYENIIGEMFAKNEKSLYYYEKNNRLEIDFIINYMQKPTLVEVKSAENTKAKSATTLLNNNVVENAIKLTTNNVCENGKFLNLPLYMAWLL